MCLSLSALDKLQLVNAPDDAGRILMECVDDLYQKHTNAEDFFEVQMKGMLQLMIYINASLSTRFHVLLLQISVLFGDIFLLVYTLFNLYLFYSKRILNCEGRQMQKILEVVDTWTPFFRYPGEETCPLFYCCRRRFFYLGPPHFTYPFPISTFADTVKDPVPALAASWTFGIHLSPYIMIS